MPRFEYILYPHPAAAYHWYCQSNSLTEYATFFFVFFCFLSMEFIAELPYKSPRLSGCFHTFSFLTIILKTFQDPTTATVTRSSKTYNRVNIKNKLEQLCTTTPFFVHFLCRHCTSTTRKCLISCCTTKFSYSF